MADQPPKPPAPPPADQLPAPAQALDEPGGAATPDEDFDDPPTSPMIFTSGADQGPSSTLTDEPHGSPHLIDGPFPDTALRPAVVQPPGQRDTLDQPAPQRERTTGRRAPVEPPAAPAVAPPPGQRDTLDQPAPQRERTTGRRAPVEAPAAAAVPAPSPGQTLDQPPPQRERTSGRRVPVEPSAAAAAPAPSPGQTLDQPPPQRERTSGRRPPADQPAAPAERVAGPGETLDQPPPPRERTSGRRMPRTSGAHVAREPQGPPPEQTVPALQTHELGPEPGPRERPDIASNEALARRLPLLVIGGGLGLTVLFGLFWVVSSGGPGPVQPSPLKPIARPTAAARPAKKAPAEEPAPTPAPAAVVAPADQIFLEESVDQGNGKVESVKRPASVIKVVSTPEATAWLGTRELGRTPLTVTLPAGPVQLRFEDKKLGLNKQVTFTAVAHQRTTEAFEFGTGWLDVQAPLLSKVSIDGVPRGTVPLEPVALFDGPHRLEVVMPTGQRAARTVETSMGRTITEYFSPPDQNEK